MRRLVAALTAALLGALAPPALGATASSAEDQAAAELAARYAPIVVVKDQSDACDRSGEAYRPVPIETVLDKPEITLLAGDGTVLATGPDAQALVGRGPETSLDFPGNPRRPGCTFEQDFQRFGKGEPNAAYAHVVADPAVPGSIVLQYWFFWYFDDYVNTHEGDWEFIQIVFPATSAREALAATPTAVGYSQHSGGESAEWDGGKLQRRGDHPLVFAGAGSHANFYGANVYLGRSADEGFGCDDTTGPSTELPVQARTVPSSPPDPQGPWAWLLFQGRWGEFQPTPYDAPPGPQTKKEWSAPMVWQESLRDSSFAIPAGKTLGPTATGSFCAVVEVGGRIYTAVTSPLVLGLIVLGIVAVGTGAARSTRWSPPLPHPLVRRRTSGQILREALAVYRGHRLPMLALGALFVPAAVVEAIAQEIVFSLTPAGSLAATAGSDSMVSATLALIVGGAGHLVASVIVVAGVAWLVRELDAGRRPGVGDVYSALGRSLRPVLGALGLSAAAIVGLSLTVVGIPLAVLLIIRWAVSPQACVLEGLAARQALRRSRALTAGRLLRTFRLAALVNVIGAISGPVIGIALLFLTALPLATINGVSSLVFVVAIPFVGAAMALLYGDLVAAEREAVSAA